MPQARKALLIGVDYYDYDPQLHGCVRDATSMKTALGLHHNGDFNFHTRLRTASNERSAISRVEVRELVEELFSSKAEVVLFYFAGHGLVTSTGGYLATSECKNQHDGVSLAEILTLANKSPASNKMIILDSCYAGSIRTSPTNGDHAQLGGGLTVLAASTEGQSAREKDGHGVFTHLLLDALSGAAANILGHITPGSVYAHIDRSLGEWGQRPVFMSNIERFVSLRNAEPLITMTDLRMITSLFPSREYDFPLDPSYEPTSDSANPEHTRKFEVLQRYNRVGLMVPVGAEHPYYAAMESQSCRLTVVGEHYRQLVADERI